ncbi:DNA topology modulation protein FlaR [Rhizobium sp. NRK18]|uniref:DNA topology modulation protein FlaR n=1 Tax=Rhizobium sp. NRK18 TaxID=2964667 RepID=UPI0021C3A775|nr:DNA topology modulation protein FlaR [Rhizobium sp. NRK18]MCQ2005142.1 DNA topology modulation protein FlaR [Rhizobium sp. NRK18]
MRRLIVTGANGSGKSHLAYRLGRLRPDIPVVSFDAIKLERDWRVRPRNVVFAELARMVATDAWILEGGPSLLLHALTRADAVIWLDPPVMLRAWRLIVRPWRNFGKTRPELPEGNRDWPWSQYRFAFKSLIAGQRFRRTIRMHFSDNGDVTVLHCRTERDIETAVALWASGAAASQAPTARW